MSKRNTKTIKLPRKTFDPAKSFFGPRCGSFACSFTSFTVMEGSKSRENLPKSISRNGWSCVGQLYYLGGLSHVDVDASFAGHGLAVQVCFCGSLMALCGSMLIFHHLHPLRSARMRGKSHGKLLAQNELSYNDLLSGPLDTAIFNNMSTTSCRRNK